ncbi:unnamed protein product [Heligmosomoides polygyrus]|uniref:Uncharacterized protein n=1 Tax=Heligmosomoides polygyrus TaxID=6339 RepID=A0A183GG57_HELPZ|nr:unnamed protein product [Heligmosomoides polygyrus]
MSSASDMTVEEIEKMILEKPSQADQIAAMKSMIERLMAKVDDISNKGPAQVRDMVSNFSNSLTVLGIPAKEAKKPAKKAVAVARATHYDDVNGRLESRDGERFFYRLAKVRHHQTEDVEKFFGINDENGHLLMDRKMVLNRWRTYFEEVSTIEFAHPSIPSSPPVYGPVQKIIEEEVEAALKKMKPGRATGPNDLATYGS